MIKRYIKRNPYDVVYSAINRWRSTVNLSYVLRKARYIPISNIPYYAFRFFIHRLNGAFDSSKALPTWGPRFKSIDHFRKILSLEELCALQWGHCCNSAEKSLNLLKAQGVLVYEMNYEDFVVNPYSIIVDCMSFFDFKYDKSILKESVSNINDFSIGKSSKISNSQRNKIKLTLDRLNNGSFY